MKSQGKPGIVKEFCIIFIQFKEKPGKTDYLVHILFSSSLFIVTHQVVAQFVVS